MKLTGLDKQIKYGEPWKLNPEATSIAVPLLVVNRIKGARNYHLYSEVADQVIVEDTGDQYNVKIINNSKMAVFFKKGLILEGKTQNRVIVNSIIVKPNKTISAKILCIHQSSGIYGGATFKVGGYAPELVLNHLHKGQSDTWNSVKAFTSGANSLETQNTGGIYAMSAFGMSRRSSGISPLIGATLNYTTTTDYSDNDTYPTNGSDSFIGLDSFGDRGSDDLLGHIHSSGDEIEQALANLPPNHEDQIGIAIVDEYGVRAFEIFDRPDAWEALSQEVVKNYSNILNNAKKNGKEIDQETAYRLLDDFIAYVSSKNGKRVNGDTHAHTESFNDRMVVGEFSKLYNTRIHVLINRLVNQSFPTTLVTKERYGQSVKINKPKLEQQNKSPIDEQMEAAFKINFLSKKRGYSTTASIADGNKTFGNIQRNTRMSTKTVSEALKEGMELGLIYKTGNQYELTDEGKELDPQKFKRAFGR